MFQKKVDALMEKEGENETLTTELQTLF